MFTKVKSIRLHSLIQGAILMGGFYIVCNTRSEVIQELYLVKCS